MHFGVNMCFLIISHIPLNNSVQSMFNGAVMFNGDLTFWETYAVTNMDVSFEFILPWESICLK